MLGKAYNVGNGRGANIKALLTIMQKEKGYYLVSFWQKLVRRYSGIFAINDKIGGF
jgi:hypothetical protein